VTSELARAADLLDGTSSDVISFYDEVEKDIFCLCNITFGLSVIWCSGEGRGGGGLRQGLS